MQQLDSPSCDQLIVGTEGFSDASVYRLADGTLLVQSLDFFPPLVDDPYVFGQIAAANSLSDVFAMGAKPITALNIAAFPDDQLPLETLTEILRGGDSKVHEAGAVTAGGHTVRDTEIKYGLSVTGLCNNDQLLHNSAAKPGDVLVLTKPLGTGFLTTAMKRRKASVHSEALAIAAMTTLNMAAARAASTLKVSSVTDITGFGLAGHAVEMADASQVTLSINVASLPALDDAIDCFLAGHVTRASQSNREGNTQRITGLRTLETPRVELLFDPQTSGGLLVAMPEHSVDNFITEVNDNQPFTPVVIGEVLERIEYSLVIH